MCAWLFCMSRGRFGRPRIPLRMLLSGGNWPMCILGGIGHGVLASVFHYLLGWGMRLACLHNQLGGGCMDMSYTIEEC